MADAGSDVNPAAAPAAVAEPVVGGDVIDPAVRDAAWAMTPVQATQWLDNRAAEYAAARAAEAAQFKTNAEIKLAALTSDPTWIRKFTQGSIAERREYQQLTQEIAAAAAEVGTSVNVGPVEVVDGVSDVHGIRERDMIDAIEDLSKIGIPDAGIIATLTTGFSDEDVAWAQRELDKCLATKEWTDGLLRKDPQVMHEWTALCAVAGSRRIL
jgi:hypothetical protein